MKLRTITSSALASINMTGVSRDAIAFVLLRGTAISTGNGFHVVTLGEQLEGFGLLEAKIANELQRLHFIVNAKGEVTALLAPHSDSVLTTILYGTGNDSDSDLDLADEFGGLQ